MGAVAAEWLLFLKTKLPLVEMISFASSYYKKVISQMLSVIKVLDCWDAKIKLRSF